MIDRQWIFPLNQIKKMYRKNLNCLKLIFFFCLNQKIILVISKKTLINIHFSKFGTRIAERVPQCIRDGPCPQLLETSEQEESQTSRCQSPAPQENTKYKSGFTFEQRILCDLHQGVTPFCWRKEE